MAEIASILGIGSTLLGGIFGGRSNRRRQQEAEAEARRQQQLLMDEQARRNFASQIFQQDTEGLSMGGRDRARADLGRTFAHNLRGANQLSAAALGGLGNNSLLANQVSGNSRRSALMESNAANALDMQYLGQRLGLRGQYSANVAGRDQADLGRMQSSGNQITSLVGQRQYSGDTWGPLLQSFGGFGMGGGLNSTVAGFGDLFRSTAVNPNPQAGSYPSRRDFMYRS